MMAFKRSFFIVLFIFKLILIKFKIFLKADSVNLSDVQFLRPLFRKAKIEQMIIMPAMPSI